MGTANFNHLIMSHDLLDNLHIEKGAFGLVAGPGHGYFTFPKLTGPTGPRMTFNGDKKIVWSLNDYLGLSTHPEVARVDAEAAAIHTMSVPMGSRIMSGHRDEHEQLEKNLARFVGKESAVVFNFGYPGAVSSIDAILNRHDVVIYDEECHACIIDGVRLHAGKRMAFRHNDIAHLEKQLYRAREHTRITGGGILVISEGVFSMRGDQGRLKEIVALKPEYGFRFFVDDAHGFGVLGPSGAGTPEEQGVSDAIDFHFATFAKSMASIGAFLAAKEHIVRYLYYNARSQVYSKSLPMTITLGALKRLELLQHGNHLRKKVWENARKLREGLRSLGLSAGEGESPITPVYMKGSLEEAKKLLMDLRDKHHIFCSGVIYPVVPRGVILFRLVPTAKHSDRDINATVEAFGRVYENLKAGLYREADVYI